MLHNSYDNHSRMRAYRHVLAGIRYHKGEKLSFLTIGFKRGTIIDVRLFLQKLTTWVKRYTGMRIDYYRVTVYDNKSPDGKWRIHMHIIWNALLDMKRRDFTFDDVIRELLEISEVYVPETFDGR